MFNKLFFILLFAIGFSACARFGSVKTNGSEPAASRPEESPTPTPTPPKKPVYFTLCKISNGAGRIFHATDIDRDESEAKARHECQIYSKNCFLLDCSLTTQED